jgi:hypothetical protein
MRWQAVATSGFSYESVPSSVGYPHADGFDPPASDTNDFRLRRREADEDKMRQQVGREAAGKHERLSRTAPSRSSQDRERQPIR